MSIQPSAPDEVVQGLLREAYTAVANGHPAHALRLVLNVLHIAGGQAAAAPALNRVLTQLTANNQRSALQDLTELFARAASVGGEVAPPAGGCSGGSDSMSMSTSGVPDRTASGGDGGAGGGGAGGWAAGGCSGVEEATSAWSGQDGLTAMVGPQQHAPILAETGREGFMACALEDGSSYVCSRCRGVVLRARQQQHEQYWCQ